MFVVLALGGSDSTLFAQGVQGAAPIVIREEFKVGYQFHVNCHVDINGELILAPEKGQTPARIPVVGKSVIKYDERILELKEGRVDRTVRYYEQMDFERRAGKNDQRGSLRKEARRLVILRHKQFEVPFCPHGPLLWDEIDMVRTDVFTPALAGLLPISAVRLRDSWAADLTAVQELTDLEKIVKGGLTCIFEEVTADRRYARISLQGKVHGIGEDGPALHHIDGYLLFDLSSRHMSYLSIKGTQHMLDKDGKLTGGRIEGTFVLSREETPATTEVSDAALKGLTLEPNEQNTLLWFISPEVGASFLYPRHWHVAGVNSEKRQIGLDEKRGSGLLISVDAVASIPSAAAFQKEVSSNLAKQNGAIIKMETARALVSGLETFGVEAEISGKRVALSYFLVRQKAGGAVLTANLQAADRQTAQQDAERIARSLVIMAPTK
jgi:hypothetical protein